MKEISSVICYVRLLLLVVVVVYIYIYIYYIYIYIYTCIYIYICIYTHVSTHVHRCMYMFGSVFCSRCLCTFWWHGAVMGWTHGLMDVLMYGRMDVRTYGRMDVCADNTSLIQKHMTYMYVHTCTLSTSCLGGNTFGYFWVGKRFGARVISFEPGIDQVSTRSRRIVNTMLFSSGDPSQTSGDWFQCESTLGSKGLCQCPSISNAISSANSTNVYYITSNIILWYDIIYD